MRLAISRAVALETSRGWRISKDKQTHKIDLVVALAMSAYAAVAGARVVEENIPFVMPWFESSGPRYFPGSDVFAGEVACPAAAEAAPARKIGPPGWTNGLSDVPLSYRRTNPGNEAWRNYILPDGSISMRPRGGWGFP